MSTPRAAGKVVADVGFAGLRCAKVVGSANESASRTNKVCSLSLLIIINLSVAYRSINRKGRRGFRRGTAKDFLCRPLRYPLRASAFECSRKRDKTRENGKRLLYVRRTLVCRAHGLHFSCVLLRHGQAKAYLTFSVTRAAQHLPVSSTNPSRRHTTCQCSL